MPPIESGAPDRRTLFFVSPSLAARDPPSLASPHPSGTHAPSRVVGRHCPARGRFHSRAYDVGSNSSLTANFGRQGNCSVQGARVGRKGTPLPEVSKPPLPGGFPFDPISVSPHCPCNSPHAPMSDIPHCPGGFPLWPKETIPALRDIAAPRTHARRCVAGSVPTTHRLVFGPDFANSSRFHSAPFQRRQ